MATLSWNSASNSPATIQSCGGGSGGVEDDLELLMAEKKRKRMESNRESARRSRVKKQKHFDDLMTLVAGLKAENGKILAGIDAATRHSANLEAENSILRAQMMELTRRLSSLNEILIYLSLSASPSPSAAGSCMYMAEEWQNLSFPESLMNSTSWNATGVISSNLHPLMATAQTIFDY